MRHNETDSKTKYTETDRQENRSHINSEICTKRLTDRKTDYIQTVKDVHTDCRTEKQMT